MLVNAKFEQHVQSPNTSLVPLVSFTYLIDNYGTYISTKKTSLTETLFVEPLLLNIPSIRESVDIENRNLKTNTVNLSISNIPYFENETVRFSDYSQEIQSKECVIFWIVPLVGDEVLDILANRLTVYKGNVNTITHNEKTCSLVIEDLTQETLHTDLPVAKIYPKTEILDKYKHKRKPIIYGYSKNHPVVIEDAFDTTEDFKVFPDDTEKFRLRGYVSANPLKINMEDYSVQVQALSSVPSNIPDSESEYPEKRQYRINDNHDITLKRTFYPNTEQSGENPEDIPALTPSNFIAQNQAEGLYLPKQEFFINTIGLDMVADMVERDWYTYIFTIFDNDDQQILNPETFANIWKNTKAISGDLTDTGEEGNVEILLKLLSQTEVESEPYYGNLTYTFYTAVWKSKFLTFHINHEDISDNDWFPSIIVPVYHMVFGEVLSTNTQTGMTADLKLRVYHIHRDGGTTNAGTTNWTDMSPETVLFARNVNKMNYETTQWDGSSSNTDSKGDSIAFSMQGVSSSITEEGKFISGIVDTKINYFSSYSIGHINNIFNKKLMVEVKGRTGEENNTVYFDPQYCRVEYLEIDSPESDISSFKIHYFLGYDEEGNLGTEDDNVTSWYQIDIYSIKYPTLASAFQTNTIDVYDQMAWFSKNSTILRIVFTLPADNHLTEYEFDLRLQYFWDAFQYGDSWSDYMDDINEAEHFIKGQYAYNADGSLWEWDYIEGTVESHVSNSNPNLYTNDNFDFDPTDTYFNWIWQTVKIKRIGIVQNYIELPCDIIYHLVDQELGFGNSINQFDLEIARSEHKDWYFSVSQSDKISSKKLIEQIARECKCFPKVKGTGSLGFNTILDDYTDYEDIFPDNFKLIETNDIIKYKFDRTKVGNLKTRVKILYGYDQIEKNHLKETRYLSAFQVEEAYLELLQYSVISDGQNVPTGITQGHWLYIAELEEGETYTVTCDVNQVYNQSYVKFRAYNSYGDTGYDLYALPPNMGSTADEDNFSVEFTFQNLFEDQTGGEGLTGKDNLIIQFGNGGSVGLGYWQGEITNIKVAKSDQLIFGDADPDSVESDIDIIGYDPNFNNIDYYHKDTTLEFESKYIQDDLTALKLRLFLLRWYRELHNIIELELPLRYYGLEVGDIIRMDNIINNLLLFGEDYTTIETRQDQEIFPYFMVTETVKNIDKVSIKSVQMHNNIDGIDDSIWDLWMNNQENTLNQTNAPIGEHLENIIESRIINDKIDTKTKDKNDK